VVLKIELNESNAGASAKRSTINASDSVFRGLVINRFADSGVEPTGTNN